MNPSSPAPPPPKKGLGFLPVVALFVFVIGPALFGACMLGVSKLDLSENRVARRSPAPAPVPDGPQLRLEDWNWGRSSDSFVTAKGLVTNLTDEPLKGVMAVVTFYAKDGTFITSDDGMIDYQPVLPGQTSPWDVIVPWNPSMGTAWVEFKLMFGGTLKHTGP